MIRLVLALSIILFLSACGNTKSDRAISGAGLGAGAGAIGAGLASGSVLTGAAIGAAAGAAAGALTDKDDVNLGKPVWK
jgi:osmotically inducible lipoprotein OsmB